MSDNNENDFGKIMKSLIDTFQPRRDLLKESRSEPSFLGTSVLNLGGKPEVLAVYGSRAEHIGQHSELRGCKTAIRRQALRLDKAGLSGEDKEAALAIDRRTTAIQARRRGLAPRI